MKTIIQNLSEKVNEDLPIGFGILHTANEKPDSILRYDSRSGIVIIQEIRTKSILGVFKKEDIENLDLSEISEKCNAYGVDSKLYFLKWNIIALINKCLEFNKDLDTEFTIINNSYIIVKFDPSISENINITVVEDEVPINRFDTTVEKIEKFTSIHEFLDPDYLLN